MKLGICIGHSRRGDMGARSVGGVYEWEYNLPVGAKALEMCGEQGIPAVVVSEYDASSYSAGISDCARQLKCLGVTHAVELHFNAAGPNAHGAETLFWHNSSGGRELAGAIQGCHLDEFPSSRDRGVKPKGSSDRGALFLRKTHCPAVIYEPFFGTNPREWSEFEFAKDRLARVLVRAAQLLG